MRSTLGSREDGSCFPPLVGTDVPGGHSGRWAGQSGEGPAVYVCEILCLSRAGRPSSACEREPVRGRAGDRLGSALFS